MKTIHLLITAGLLILLSSCQNMNERQSEAEKIANAYGINGYENVTEIHFTFNVEANNQTRERTWNWNRQTSEITYTGPIEDDSVETYSYYRNKLDTTNEKMVSVDRKFINDKYWFLFPFNLVRDVHTDIDVQGEKLSPIIREKRQKLTIQYGEQGGYTPGDAYDVYYDSADYLIDVWVYRKGGEVDNPMPTTWEDHKQLGPIIVGTNHVGLNQNFRIYFDDLKLKTTDSDEWIKAQSLN